MLLYFRKVRQMKITAFHMMRIGCLIFLPLLSLVEGM